MAGLKTNQVRLWCSCSIIALLGTCALAPVVFSGEDERTPVSLNDRWDIQGGTVVIGWDAEDEILVMDDDTLVLEGLDLQIFGGTLRLNGTTVIRAFEEGAASDPIEAEPRAPDRTGPKGEGCRAYDCGQNGATGGTGPKGATGATGSTGDQGGPSSSSIPRDRWTGQAHYRNHWRARRERSTRRARRGRRKGWCRQEQILYVVDHQGD